MNYRRFQYLCKKYSQATRQEIIKAYTDIVAQCDKKGLDMSYMYGFRIKDGNVSLFNVYNVKLSTKLCND